MTIDAERGKLICIFVWVSDSLAQSLGCRTEQVIGRTDVDSFEAERACSFRVAEHDNL